MNERGVAALVSAAMRGVPQIRGAFRNGEGRCVLGVLHDALPAPLVSATAYFGLALFSVCRDCEELFASEYCLLPHLNDRHRWDFLKIARTLGPSTAP